jgi:hypothetical protein
MLPFGNKGADHTEAQFFATAPIFAVEGLAPEACKLFLGISVLFRFFGAATARERL